MQDTELGLTDAARKKRLTGLAMHTNQEGKIGSLQWRHLAIPTLTSQPRNSMSNGTNRCHVRPDTRPREHNSTSVVFPRIMQGETIIVRKPKRRHLLQNRTPVSTLNKRRVMVEHNAEEPFQIEGDERYTTTKCDACS